MINNTTRSLKILSKHRKTEMKEYRQKEDFICFLSLFKRCKLVLFINGKSNVRSFINLGIQKCKILNKCKYYLSFFIYSLSFLGKTVSPLEMVFDKI